MVNNKNQETIENLKFNQYFKKHAIKPNKQFAKLNYIESKIDYELINNEEISIDYIMNCNIVYIINHIDHIMFLLDTKNELHQELLQYKKSIEAKLLIKNKIFVILQNLRKINKKNYDMKQAINAIQALNIVVSELRDICGKTHYQLAGKYYEALSHKYSKLKYPARSLLNLYKKMSTPLFEYAKKLSNKELNNDLLKIDALINWITNYPYDISIDQMLELYQHDQLQFSNLTDIDYLHDIRKYLLYHMPTIQQSEVILNKPNIDKFKLLDMLKIFQTKFYQYNPKDKITKLFNFNLISDKDDERYGTKFLLYSFYYFCMFIINLKEDDLIKAQNYLKIATIKQHIKIEYDKKQYNLNLRNTTPRTYDNIDKWIAKKLKSYVIRKKINKQWINSNQSSLKKQFANSYFAQYVEYCHSVSDKKYPIKNISEFCTSYNLTEPISTKNKFYENFTIKVARAIEIYVS